MRHYEPSVAVSSEWRSPGPTLLERIGLEYGLDSCGPLSGYYAVKTKKVFTVVDNGLVQSWRGYGLVYCNPPWAEQRRAVLRWLDKFFEEADGGIFVCVARTSADWFQDGVLARAELICFPYGKTRFYQPDGMPGPAPTNGIALIGKGEIACDALRRSGLGYCLSVDRTAAPPARAANGGRRS